MVGTTAQRLVNEIAEAALDAVRRSLLNVPDGALSVQPAVDAPGATIESSWQGAEYTLGVSDADLCSANIGSETN